MAEDWLFDFTAERTDLRYNYNEKNSIVDGWWKKVFGKYFHCNVFVFKYMLISILECVIEYVLILEH